MENNNFMSNHHILHTEAQWNSSPLSKRLRENPSLQIKLPMPNHVELHKNAPHVPLLGPHALLLVAKEFEPEHNHQRSIDSLLRAIEKSAHHPRAHVLEKSLAQLAIWSIEEQIPYLDLRRYH